VAETPAGADASTVRVASSSANWANAVTLLRVALVPVIALLVIRRGEAAQWWAFAIFSFAAFTDAFDGWVARRAVGVSRWGQLADPIADKVLIVGSLSVLAYVGRLPWVAVLIIVLREVAVTLQRVWLLRRGVVMPASGWGKLKTLTQIVAVALYLLPAAPRGLAAAALIVALLLTIGSGLEYALRGRRLLRDA
jgi:CDP-diacylglycerol--glycerol-3-phosphate 3-phosphatidyltransferase